MKKTMFRLFAGLILVAMVAGMLMPMSAFAAAQSREITNTLGNYPYPYPLQGNRLEYCSWNERDNTLNSIWYNDSEDSFYNVKAKTDGYTDNNGVHHPYGIGMHSSIKFAPSAVYSIDSFKITSFKTTVYLVQYDMADEEGMIDITPTADELVPIVVYLDFGIMMNGTIYWTQSDEYSGEVTYPVEASLLKKDAAGEDNSVVLQADAADLEGYTHIRIGIKTRHGIYKSGFDGDYMSYWHDSYLIGNTAMASVYFADLEITQSEEVPVITAPSIPARPTASPAQNNAYEDLLAPGCDEDNWYSKPYGAWKAGNNKKYYLSDMAYLQSSNTPSTEYSQGQPTTVNHPYSTSAGTSFLFGAEGMEHEIENGIGMHPKNPKQPVLGRTDSWTVYDVSMLTSAGVDTFYALVGLTSEANAWGSRLSSAGVYAYIYGDKVGDGQHYELLATSDLITGYYIGEFNVNIKDVKLLLIDVVLRSSATSHGYSAVGFGNACLFKESKNAVKPDYSADFVPDSDCWGDSHVYSPDTWEKYSVLKHTNTCDCGQKTIYENHNWNNGKITTAATHQNAGVKTYTCKDCGAKKEETVAKIKHSWSSVWEKENALTHKRTCECGEIKRENHTYTDDQDLICNDCGYQRNAADGTSSTATTSSTDDETLTLRKILAGCSSTTGGTALSIALTSLSAAWVSMKKKKSDEED